MDNLLGITRRERELIDRNELGGDNSPALITELNGLRAARGEGPITPALAEVEPDPA